MNATKEHTAVMLMLCVTTFRDPTTACAKMDFLELEEPALVSIKTVICQFWLNTLYNTQGCFLTHKHNNNNKHKPKDNHPKGTQNKSIRTYLGRCWDP